MVFQFTDANSSWRSIKMVKSKWSWEIVDLSKGYFLYSITLTKGSNYWYGPWLFTPLICQSRLLISLLHQYKPFTGIEMLQRIATFKVHFPNLVFSIEVCLQEDWLASKFHQLWELRTLVNKGKHYCTADLLFIFCRFSCFDYGREHSLTS